MQHKCFKCGTEFDGNFCPECGEKWQENKTCPTCGATLAGNAKFCNQCGYSFLSKPSAPAAAKSPTASTPVRATSKKRLYAVCRYLPYVFLSLLSVLFFFFYLAPVAVMPGGEFLGETIPSESYGNFYQMISGDIFPSLAASAKAAVILSALLAFTALFIVFLLLVKRGTDGARPFCILGSVFLLAIFIVVCVMIGILGKEDGGMGMIATGAAPILVIVFSGLYAVLSVAAICVAKHIERQDPDINDNHGEKHDALEAQQGQDEAEWIEQYQESTPAPVPPQKMEPPTKPQKPVKPIYCSIVPEDQREELMPEMVKHIKRKRTIAALLFFHLSMSATLAFLFWTYYNYFLIALGGIPFIIASICLIVWSRKCHIRDWHPEKIYRYKRLTASIIILSVEFFVTISSLFVSFRFSLGNNQYMNQYLVNYSENVLSLDRTYGYDFDDAWVYPRGNYMQVGTDEEAHLIYQADKANLVYEDSSQESAYRNIEDGFIIYKLEADREFLDAALSDYIRNDENVAKYSQEQWAYVFTATVEGTCAVSISTDATNWVPFEDYIYRSYYGFDLKIPLSDHSSDPDCVYIKIEDVNDGVRLETVSYKLCTVCELYPTIFEMVANGHENTLTVSLGVSLLYLTIAIITLFCQTHKTAKQRKALCMKLCGATSIKSSEISVKYTKECLAYAASMREYRRQLATYHNNQRERAVYRYQVKRYEKGKPYQNISYPRIWCYTHRIALSVTSVILAAVITVTCVFALRDTRFRAENLIKIGLGADEKRVTEVLGEPFQKETNGWYYFSKNYASIMEEMEELEERSKNVSSYEEFEKLAEKSEKLQKELEGLEYQIIFIAYSADGTVERIILDTKASDTMPPEKTITEVTIFPTYYTLGSNTRVSYSIACDDGSYRMAYFSKSQLPTSKGEQTIEWYDGWGQCSATIFVR